MSADDPKHTLTPSYAYGQLVKSLTTASAHADPSVRARAAARLAQWEGVLTGMADGSLTVGARTPVRGVPAWATLEVAHGGFATGALRAEGPLLPLEEALAEAFRQGPYALADLDAVRGLVRNGAALLRDKEHLVDAARSWLAAAAALRKGGTPVTFATLAWQMSTLGAARGAEALARRDEAINREAHQELQGLGGEAPREAVRVPPRR